MATATPKKRGSHTRTRRFPGEPCRSRKTGRVLRPDLAQRRRERAARALGWNGEGDVRAFLQKANEGR